MNKLKLLIVLMAIWVTPTFANATDSKMFSKNSEITAVSILIERLDEINAMDKSSKSRAEKSTLRKEVKSIEKQLKKSSGGGLYISLGGALLILLIIIILL